MTRRKVPIEPPSPVDWQPLPGMEKLCCARCHHDFARPVGSPHVMCPDCIILASRVHAAEETPFDPV